MTQTLLTEIVDGILCHT